MYKSNTEYRFRILLVVFDCTVNIQIARHQRDIVNIIVIILLLNSILLLRDHRRSMLTIWWDDDVGKRTAFEKSIYEHNIKIPINYISYYICL